MKEEQIVNSSRNVSRRIPHTLFPNFVLLSILDTGLIRELHCLLHANWYLFVQSERVSLSRKGIDRRAMQSKLEQNVPPKCGDSAIIVRHFLGRAWLFVLSVARASLYLQQRQRGPRVCVLVWQYVIINLLHTGN